MHWFPKEDLTDFVSFAQFISAAIRSIICFKPSTLLLATIITQFVSIFPQTKQQMSTDILTQIRECPTFSPWQAREDWHTCRARLLALGSGQMITARQWIISRLDELL